MASDENSGNGGQLPLNPQSNEAGEARPEDWPESPELGQSESSAQEMAQYGATVRRIERLIGLVGMGCAAAVVWPLGWTLAAGVLLGTVLGWINFRWLVASVNAISERIVKVKSGERGAAVVFAQVGQAEGIMHVSFYYNLIRQPGCYT